MAKPVSNIRLSDEALTIIASEAKRTGATKTSVVEMMVRAWAVTSVWLVPTKDDLPIAS
jgi:hypothetical protein